MSAKNPVGPPLTHEWAYLDTGKWIVYEPSVSRKLEEQLATGDPQIVTIPGPTPSITYDVDVKSKTQRNTCVCSLQCMCLIA